MERSRKLLTILTSPFRAADKPSNFSSSERNLFSDRTPVIGMFFYEGDENLMRELAGLPQLGVGANDNMLFGNSSVEFDF
jgi:hypothetical protein